MINFKKKLVKQDVIFKELRQSKEFYKEFLVIAKDTLDVGWKLAPLAFLPAGMFLWVYLRSIHWTGLFQDSAMTTSGLVFLFTAALGLMFAVLLQFTLPSIILICTTSVCAKEQFIRDHVLLIHRWALLGWLCGILIVSFITKKNFLWLTIAFSFSTALFYSVYHQYKGKIFLLNLSLINCFMKNTIWSILATLAMASTSVPLLIGLKNAKYVPNIHDGWQTEVLIIICIFFITIISLLPGFIYLNARTSITESYRPIKFAIVGAFISSYTVIMVIAFFVPISFKVLELSGIYNNDLRTYQVRESKLMPVLSRIGLITPTNTPDLTLVRAYLRYGFGGYKLLCRDRFDPDTLSQESIKKAEVDKKPDPGFTAGNHCAPVHSGEIREIKE